jgi:hypothetical protein
MNVQEQIKNCFESLPDPKCAELEALHQRILQALPKCKLRYLGGKDDNGKIVSNPNIGLGHRLQKNKLHS